MARTLWGKARSDLETTQWRRIIKAGDNAAREGLTELCEAYWQPVYRFVRARGFARAEAENLTQKFLASLLAPGALARFDPQLGRFRDWVRASLSHFLGNELAYRRLQKRGGAQRRIALDRDVAAAEEEALERGSAAETPDRIFDRRWAEAVTARAFARVREDFVRSGQGELFARLERRLAGEAYESVAERQRGPAPSGKGLLVARHRMRRTMADRYRHYLREEIADTVASCDDVDDEIRLLLEALD
jgi:hypothetical protein